jgi:hypothetical protein
MVVADAGLMAVKVAGDWVFEYGRQKEIIFVSMRRLVPLFIQYCGNKSSDDLDRRKLSRSQTDQQSSRRAYQSTEGKAKCNEGPQNLKVDIKL